MLEELRIRIRVFEPWYANASNLFSLHHIIENPKMLRIEFWTSENWSKRAQNDTGTLIIGFALKNYAQKWSQIVKMLDG